MATAELYLGKIYFESRVLFVFSSSSEKVGASFCHFAIRVFQLTVSNFPAWIRLSLFGRRR